MKTSLYDQEYMQNLLQEDQSVTNMRYPSTTLTSQMKKSYQLKEYNQNYSSKSSAPQQKSQQSYNELKHNLLANKNIDVLQKNNTNNMQNNNNINRMSPTKQQPEGSSQQQNSYQQIKENIRPTSTDLTSHYLSQKLMMNSNTNATSQIMKQHDKQKYRVGTLPSEDNSFDKFDYLLANDTYKKPLGRQSTIVSSSTQNSQMKNNNIDLENNVEIGQKNKQTISNSNNNNSSTLISKKYYQQRGRESQKCDTISSNYDKISPNYNNSTPKNGVSNQSNISNNNQNNSSVNNNAGSIPQQIPGNYQSYTLNNARPQSQYAPRSSNIENKSVSLENFEFAQEKKKQQLKEIEQKLQMTRQKSKDKNLNYESSNNGNIMKNSSTSTTAATSTIYSNYLIEKQKLMESHDLNNNITSTIKNSFLNYKQRTDKNSKISINPAVSLDLQKYGTKQRNNQTHLNQQENIQNSHNIEQQQNKIEMLNQFDAKKNSISSVNTTTESYQNQIQLGGARFSQKSTSTNTSVLSNNITSSLYNNQQKLTNNNLETNNEFSTKSDNQMKTLKKQNFKKDSLQNIEINNDNENNIKNINDSEKEITLSQKIQQTQIQLQNQEQMYKNLNYNKNIPKQYNNYVSEITEKNKVTNKTSYSQQQQNGQQSQQEDSQQPVVTTNSTYLKFNKSSEDKPPQQQKQLNIHLNEESNANSNTNQIKVNYRSATPQNNKSGTGIKQEQQNQNQNSLQSTNQKKKDEYQEYKKLQEKLNFLENKILSIKTNIEINQNSQQQFTNAGTAIQTEKNQNKYTQQASMSHQKLLQQKDVRLSLDKQMNKNLIESNYNNENNQKSIINKTMNQNQTTTIQNNKEENNEQSQQQTNTLKTQQQQSQQLAQQKKNSFFSPSNKIYQTLHTGQTPKTSTNHQNEVGFTFFNNNNNNNGTQNKQSQYQQQQTLNQQQQQQKHLKKVQHTQIESQNPHISNNKMTKSQQISTYQKIMQKNESLRQSAVTSSINNSNNNNVVTQSTTGSNNYFNSKSTKNSNIQLFNQQQNSTSAKINENNSINQKNDQQTQQLSNNNQQQQNTAYYNQNSTITNSQNNSTTNNNLKSQAQQSQTTIGAGLQSLVTQINKGNFLPAGFTTTNKQFQKIQQEQILKNGGGTSTGGGEQNEKNQQSQSQQQQQQQSQQIPKSFLHNRVTDKNNGDKNNNANKNQNHTTTKNSTNNTQQSNQKNNNQSNLATSNFSAYRKSQIQKETQQNKEIFEQKLVQQCKNLYYLPKVIHSFMDEEESTYFIQLFREHLVQTMQAINFSKFLRPVSQKVIDEKKQNFARKNYYKDKKTLIFDLDETLIHCNDNINIPSDVILPIQFPNGDIIEAGINIRPYTLDCLKELSLYYEIIVFTASHSCYANVVLDYLDPNQEYIQHRLFRENCVQTEEGIYIKDLRVIGNREINNLIIIDNAAYSFGFHIDNGIPIIPYYDNKEDTELKDLTNYLKKLHNVENIREINSLVFKLNNFAEYQDPSMLAQSIYQDLVNNNNQLEC